MNRTYFQDLKAQIELKHAISAEKAEEDVILSEMKSLKPWMADDDDERGNVVSQTCGSLSEGLRMEKMQYLQAKLQAKEIRQKAYEDLVSSHSSFL
ncbi:unnamed protein product [Dibothriocephalus latus]|uniref:Uncharacterized protein n=1 Tax=Dibothriocephalus latus TaxID=60516 RepID=A0A3P7MGA8_DIBLA|nr:unnamed protein product [Dibothriocephalus latus]